MKTWMVRSIPVAVIVASALWTAVAIRRQTPSRPVIGSIYRSKVDNDGHTRGIVQVDLMRRLLADRARSGAVDPGPRRVPSVAHPLLGRPAPPLTLADPTGRSYDLGRRREQGPVVLVFYLGASCVACMSHLVELDAALPRFRERGAAVWAISSDSPEVSRWRAERYGELSIPILSSPDHAVAAAYGAWKPIAGGGPDDGEALHGTFVIGRDGTVLWAYLGDRPFDDVEALLSELPDRSDVPSRAQDARGIDPGHALEGASR